MGYLFSQHPLLFEPGDRMSREEFLERWERMPELKNAELIDGVVYMPSPVSFYHGGFDGQFHMLLSNYAGRTLGCKFLPNTTWLMLESAPQPDAALCVLPEYGGTVTVPEKLISGAPELVTEVAASSRSYDLGPKLALYQRSQVLEYVTAILEDRRIEWRVLEGGSYHLMAPDTDGVFRSRIFPGLWVDEGAFWREDMQALLDVLEEGLRSAEHARLVEELERRRATRP